MYGLYIESKMLLDSNGKPSLRLRQVNRDGKAGVLHGVGGGNDFESIYSVIDVCDNNRHIAGIRNDFVIAWGQHDRLFGGNNDRQESNFKSHFSCVSERNLGSNFSATRVINLKIWNNNINLCSWGHDDDS